MNWVKGFVLFLVAVLSLAFVPNAAKADGCFKHSYGAYNYAPVYQKVYAVPYQGYSYAYQPYYYPKVLEAIVAPDYYYSAGAAVRDKVLSDVLKLLEKQLDKNQAGTVPPTYAPQGPGPEGSLPPGKVLQAPMEPLRQSQQPTSDADLDARLLAVVSKSCVNCHGATPTRGAGVPFVTADGKLFQHSPEVWNEAFVRVNMEGTPEFMPKGGKALVPDEAFLFRLKRNAASAAQAKGK